MTYQQYRTLTVDDPKFPGPLHVEVLITMERALYGTDADGRRGQWRDDVIDFAVESVYDLETGNEVTAQYEDSAELFRAIRRDL